MWHLPIDLQARGFQKSLFTAGICIPFIPFMHKIYYWIRLQRDRLRGYITGPKIASASTKLLTPSGLADSTARRDSAAQAHYTKGEKNRKVNLVYTYIERRHGQAPDASRGPASTIYSVNRRTEKTKNRT